MERAKKAIARVARVRELAAAAAAAGAPCAQAAWVLLRIVPQARDYDAPSVTAAAGSGSCRSAR
eukprot:14115018-Alexandrium_andersonii.AAC.1